MPPRQPPTLAVDNPSQTPGMPHAAETDDVKPGGPAGPIATVTNGFALAQGPAKHSHSDGLALGCSAAAAAIGCALRPPGRPESCPGRSTDSRTAIAAAATAPDGGTHRRS
ncbi:Protein of unknown function [Mycobacterium canettii CIPT 140070010]|nr:Protein of unknown function [Mycobacterium canettii CIPT 140070010]